MKTPTTRLDVLEAQMADLLGLQGKRTAMSGTYSPTFTPTANLDGTVVGTGMWHRVGDVVHVRGQFTADPTAGSTTTRFTISLPVPSDFSASTDLTGAAVIGDNTGGAGSGGAVINASTSTNVAAVEWRSTQTASASWQYSFTYLVK